MLGGAPPPRWCSPPTSTPVRRPTRAVRELEARTAAATGTERAAFTAELDELRSSVRAEKLGEVATEFDRVHNIQRAVEVGSVDAVIRAAELRPRIIDAIESRLR
ncbi:hypothetical protein GCM10027614_07240 [Micromonospora vulcania]